MKNFFILGAFAITILSGLNSDAQDYYVPMQYEDAYSGETVHNSANIEQTTISKASTNAIPGTVVTMPEYSAPATVEYSAPAPIQYSTPSQYSSPVPATAPAVQQFDQMQFYQQFQAQPATCLAGG